MLTRVSGLRDKGAYVPKVLKDDLLAIKALYLKEGFMEAAVQEDVQLSNGGKDVAIHLTIDEGIRTMVSSVTIQGITTVSENEALDAISLKVEEPFRKYMVGPDENALSALIAEKGYPHVTVKGDVLIGQDRSDARVTYDVDEGPSVKMGNIYTAGNFRTREKILRNEIELEPGEPFSLARMLGGQRNIRDMNIFQSVRFKTIGLGEKERIVNLFVEVEEKKPYYIQTEGGYDSARGFFAKAKGGDHNLFGTNKDAWVGGDVSQIGYRTDMGIKEPRLLDSRISATLALFAERKQEFNQNFGTGVYGSSLVLNRTWFDHLTTGLGFRYERREQFWRDGSEAALSSADESEFAPRSILVTTPSISYDGRDSFIRPRKGLFSSFSVDVSTGLRNSLDNFLRYRLDSRYFFTPLNRLTLAFLGRGGFLQAYGEGVNIPDDQRFFLGGTNDVRGFAENMLRFDDEGESLGGRVALSGSVEARVDIGYNVELAFFYDAGTVEDTFGDVHFNTLRTSAGAGLRYITPIGPVGLLYGVKLDRKPDEDSGRLHFSIGYTF
jgi:outer membrane protein insertion porin family